MKLHGFVQAGGGSTRFGTDKALVRFAGKTMLQQTGELLESVCGEVQIVAAKGKYPLASWRVLADGWPGQGPLGGILTALSSLSGHELDHTWALIVSCDMPFLTSQFLSFLKSRASESSAQVVVPESASGLEPLCACWRATAVTDVRAAFESGVRKVTEAMKRLPMEVLDESAWKRFDTNCRLFWNMNTETDFVEARQILETDEL